MAKIQNFKRLIAEDFKDENRELISKVAYSLNPFMDDLQGALNKNLTIADNLDINQKTIDIKVDGSGTVIGSNKLKTDLNRQCEGLTVIQVTNITNPTSYPTGTPFISFTETNGVISINNITNLTASNQYKLKINLF